MAKQDANGMVEVTVLVNGYKDNGRVYMAGQTAHVHRDLIPSATAAGQVRAASTPADKQARPGVAK